MMGVRNENVDRVVEKVIVNNKREVKELLEFMRIFEVI